MELQENLVRLRHKQHLSQEELAERLGVARQTISRWEVGTVIPTADNLLALSTMYGVSVEELMDGKSEDILRDCKVASNEKPSEETAQAEDSLSQGMPPVDSGPPLANTPKKPYKKWIFRVILVCFYAGVLSWGYLRHSTGDAKIFLVFVTVLLILARIMYGLKKWNIQKGKLGNEKRH